MSNRTLNPLAYILTGWSFVVSTFTVGEPAGTFLRRFVYTAFPTQIPDLQTLIQMFYRGLIDYETLKKYAIENGFSEDWLHKFLEQQVSPLPLETVIKAYWRKIITWDKLLEEAHKQNLRAQEIELLEKASRYFPSPADLVRFAVREVYTPEIVEKYGQLQDLPPKFLEEAKKAGLPEEQAKLYWSAHWELPSPQMGYEFLHRLAPDYPEKYWEAYRRMGLEKEKIVFSLDDMRTLLRTLDVMPYWRDRIIAISYRPFNRVDIRRMYRIGVMTEEDVYWAYRELGYDDRKARMMVEFTRKEYGEEEISLSSSEILSLFREFLISENEARNYLSEIGEDERAIDLLISREKLKREKAILNKKINNLVELYRLGEIDISRLEAELLALNLPSEKVQQVIDEAQIERYKKLKMPSLRDLQNWLKLEIINEEEFRARLKNMGYRDEDIDNYTAEILR